MNRIASLLPVAVTLAASALAQAYTAENASLAFSVHTNNGDDGFHAGGPSLYLGPPSSDGVSPLLADTYSASYSSPGLSHVSGNLYELSFALQVAARPGWTIDQISLPDVLGVVAEAGKTPSITSAYHVAMTGDRSPWLSTAFGPTVKLLGPQDCWLPHGYLCPFGPNAVGWDSGFTFANLTAGTNWVSTGITSLSFSESITVDFGDLPPGIAPDLHDYYYQGAFDITMARAVPEAPTGMLMLSGLLGLMLAPRATRLRLVAATGQLREYLG